MNVLEKILEEIKQPTNYTIMCGKHFTTIDRIEEIILSHVNDTKDRNIHANDEPYMLFTLNENGVAEEYDNTYDITIHCESEEEQDRVSKILENYHGWIPVKERLPNEEEFMEAYRRNAYAAEFIVMIKGATLPTTLYFKNGSWTDMKGNYYNVVAWQPLPEPYKGE